MVDKAYGAYNLMLGDLPSTRNKTLEHLKPLFKQWALEREEGEHFGDSLLILAGVIKPTLDGKKFHDDVVEEDEE
ncbi:hypothetical protein V1519DRAFT_427813 [Lipomyces tetrasporus]